MNKLFAHLMGTWTVGTFRTYMSVLLEVMSWRVLLALVLTLCVSLTQGAQLVLLVPLMQVVGLDMGQGSLAWLSQITSSAFAALGVRPTLFTVLGAFILVTSLLALLSRSQTLFNFKLQQDFAARVRQRLYRAIANTEWLTFSRIRSSDLTHALTTEADRVGGATHLLFGLITNAIMLLVYIAVALQLSWKMTILVFAAGVVLLLLLRKKAQEARLAGKDITTATTEMYSAAIEHLDGMKTVKSYSAEERNARLFSNLADRVARMYLQATRNQADTTLLFTIGSVVILGSILYVSFDILKMPVAGFLLLIFLFNRMIPLFGSTQGYYQQYLNVLPSFERVMELQARCEEAAEPRSVGSSDFELQDAVRFDGVYFSYGGEEAAEAVRDLNLTIASGQTTAIVGPSGAGKSTIADMVMGLIKPGRGRMLVDKEPLTPERLTSWREQISYVAQETFLFNDTVRANLLWACPGADEQRIWRALRLAAAEEFVSALPEGLETFLGDRGVRLSGGERQRLALARALLREPSLLILDEATSALDSENEKRIREAIDELHGSVTILTITHRLSTIRGADIIYVLDGGRLAEAGSWEELVPREGRLRALARAQGVAGE
jgi:ATP-binding cassette subfamily C protein